MSAYVFAFTGAVLMEHKKDSAFGKFVSVDASANQLVTASVKVPEHFHEANNFYDVGIFGYFHTRSINYADSSILFFVLAYTLNDRSINGMKSYCLRESRYCQLASDTLREVLEGYRYRLCETISPSVLLFQSWIHL